MCKRFSVLLGILFMSCASLSSAVAGDRILPKPSREGAGATGGSGGAAGGGARFSGGGALSAAQVVQISSPHAKVVQGKNSDNGRRLPWHSQLKAWSLLSKLYPGARHDSCHRHTRSVRWIRCTRTRIAGKPVPQSRSVVCVMPHEALYHYADE